MANYVYGTITVHSTEDFNRLEEIAKVGMAEFYLPMPKALNITAPAQNEEERRIAEANMVRYGVADWYDWRIVNHGTKWSDYQHELNGDTLTFTTAWSPISFDIIRMFALDFPNFTYTWEEEQGFGETYIFEDGEVVEEHEWDIPSWDENGSLSEEEQEYCYMNNIMWLKEDYEKCGEIYAVGYYQYGDIEDFLGATLEEVKQLL